MNTTVAHSGFPAQTRKGLRIAMALYGDMTFDSRVIREAETLSTAGHEVTIYCLGGSPATGARFRVVARVPPGSSVLPDGGSPFLRSAGSSVAEIRRRASWVVGYAQALRAWGRMVVAAAGAVDVWHTHDLTGLLAVGPLVRSPGRLVYDSHEIFLETGTGVRLPRLFRRALAAYEGHQARRAVALITVNEDQARVLQRRLRPRRMLIVRNCPPRWTPSVKPVSQLRDSSGAPPDRPLILYHGAFSHNRGIEELAEALLYPGLESVQLALLGVGSIRPALEGLARDPRFEGRIRVHDAVPPDDLLDWVASADVDVIAIQRSTLNHWLSTPNKLWESLAVGVPVVVSDFPTMRRVVLEDPAGLLGGVCDPARPESIAAAIRAIIELPDDERARLKARCLLAAQERWNWETESSRLVDLYAEIGAEVRRPQNR